MKTFEEKGRSARPPNFLRGFLRCKFAPSPYFERLAERALIAFEEKPEALTDAVAVVLADARTGGVGHTAVAMENTRRDLLQDQLAAALLLPPLADSQSLVQRIEETAKYAARIGYLPGTDWQQDIARIYSRVSDGVPPQITALPQEPLSVEQLGALRAQWRTFLQQDLPAPFRPSPDLTSTEGRPPVPALPRRTDKAAELIRSYAPVIARRSAAALTRRSRIEKAFERYGFVPQAATIEVAPKGPTVVSQPTTEGAVDGETPERKSESGWSIWWPKVLSFYQRRFNPADNRANLYRLTSYLDGGQLAPHLNASKFQRWPKEAVSGSFAATLATELDYPPSAWMLEREIERIDTQRAVPGVTSSGGNQPPAAGAPPPTPNRPPEDPRDAAWRRGLLGLAFSGGGIRSATFNLGVLQGLAKLRMLRCVDYLSTVSGGGYIGSWLINWIRRENLDEVEHRLSPSVTPDPSDARVRPIHALRDFSNYLTPRLGLLSPDVWVMAVFWLRNTLLNLLVLLPTLVAVLILPRFLEVWASSIPLLYVFGRNRYIWWPSPWDLAIAAGILLSAVFLVALNLMDCPSNQGDASSADGRPMRRYNRPWYIRTMVLAVIFPAAWLLAVGSWSTAHIHKQWEWTSTLVLFAIATLMAFALLCITQYLANYLDATRGSSWGKHARGISLLCLVSVALGGIATLLTMSLQRTFRFWSHCRSGIMAMTVWGTPLVVLAILLLLFLFVGLAGRNLADTASKWLTRLCAYLAIYTVVWIVWVGLAIYGTNIDYTLFSLASSKFHIPAGSAGWGVVAAWLWTTLQSVLAGKSAQASGDKPGALTTSLGFYATVGPYVFIVGLMLGLAFVAERLFQYFGCYFAGAPAPRWVVLRKLGARLQDHPWASAALVCLLLAFISALALSYCVDINEFSMNRFYRNRLVRCYLGAANKERHANPFTGFDPADDGNSLASFRDRSYTGPYPIYNTTLNLVYGEELAWQERRGASFTFTPDLCGYETPWRAANDPGAFHNLQFVGYRDTASYAYPKKEEDPLRKGGVHLGTPMSISGAAVSPNMGSYSQPATAFLMTVFDVRLGWWLGNPRNRKTWERPGPKLGLLYLVKELLGLTDDRAGFVYLSDGGHFENLGIYELVRRRCRYIIACDAEEDADLAFHGLGNAIRKCREDFGVEIKLRVSDIQPDPATKLSRTHCVVGTIHYPDQTGPGYLVYLKASIVGDEPEDVLEYKRAHSAFPHQSTADQWFNESQFESYRRLGQHVAVTAFHRAIENAGDDPAGFCAKKFEFFREMQDNWYPPNAAVRSNFTRHATAYDALVHEMRSDDDLRQLSAILYPTVGVPGAQIPNAVPPVPAQKGQQRQKVFLFCVSLIQLMENVYVDLDLEGTFDDPYNAGWVAIFRQWAQAPVFREAWQRCGWTYGRTFRRFCYRRIGLPSSGQELD